MNLTASQSNPVNQGCDLMSSQPAGWQPNLSSGFGRIKPAIKSWTSAETGAASASPRSVTKHLMDNAAPRMLSFGRMPRRMSGPREHSVLTDCGAVALTLFFLRGGGHLWVAHVYNLPPDVVGSCGSTLVRGPTWVTTALWWAQSSQERCWRLI